MALLRRLSGWLEFRRRPQDASGRHSCADEDGLAPSTGYPGTDSATGRPEHTVSSKLRSPAPVGSFWDALDPTEREALRSVATWRTFAAGGRIVEEGERADHVMVILGGRAKVVVDDNGTERVLALRGLGQLIGERALGGNQRARGQNGVIMTTSAAGVLARLQVARARLHAADPVICRADRPAARL